LVRFRQSDWRCNGFGYTDFFGAADTPTRSCTGPSARLILVTLIPIVDPQAKSRLTGAVILVALVVLLVPELLSGPGAKPAAATANPAEGPALRSYTVELGDEAHGARRTPAEPAVAPQATTVAPAAGATVASTARAVQSPPVPLQAPPQAAPAQMDTAVAAPSRARPEAAPEAASESGWMIQLGSFASRGNAERLVHDLKAKGYQGFLTESANGGRKLYRVRVGPASDRASAQALAAKLRAAGHPGSLTAPRP